MNKKTILLTIFSIALSFQLFSQNKETRSWKQKTYFGGNFWLSIGNYTYIEASPTIGYWITPRFTCAAGFIYNYYKDDYYKTKANIYGERFFTRYILIKNLSKMIPINLNSSLYAHAEYEHLNLESTNTGEGTFGYDKVYVGGGLRQPIGEKGGVYLSVLYNLNDMGYFATSNPELRIGIYF